MKHNQKVKKLSKFLAYVLGRRPDEFGLCPDEDGYVKIKDLMKAVGEEAGWRHIRQGHLREVVATLTSPSVELLDKRIRAKDRTHLVSRILVKSPPKLLYHPIRRRAYPVVIEKGIWSAGGDKPIMLARSKSMAERLGRRVDSAAIILTVNTDQLTQMGVALYSLGRTLFVTDSIPAGSFSGPPLPKKAAKSKAADLSEPPAAPKTPGSYFIDLTQDTGSKKDARKKDRQRKNEWKRERKRRHRY